MFESSIAIANLSLSPQHFDFSLWRDFLKGLDANEAAMSLDPREYTAVSSADLKWLFFECREMFFIFYQLERALHVSPRRYLLGDFPTPRLLRNEAELAINSYFAANLVVLRCFLSRSPALLIPLLQISKKAGNDARRLVVSQIAEETGCRNQEIGRHVVTLCRIFEHGEANSWKIDIESLLVDEYCISEKAIRQDWISFICFARFRIICGGSSVAKRVSTLSLPCLLDCSDSLLTLLTPLTHTQNKRRCVLTLDTDLISSLKDVLRKLRTDNLSEWVSRDVLTVISESRLSTLIKAVKDFYSSVSSASPDGLKDFFGIAVRCVDSLSNNTSSRLDSTELSSGFQVIQTFLITGVSNGVADSCIRFVTFVERVVLRVSFEKM